MSNLNFFISSALLNAFIAGLLGLIVVFKNNKDLINKLFYAVSLSVVVWSIGYWQWLSSTDASSALFWTRILSIGSLIIPIFYLHWILAFVDLHIKKKNLLRLIYLVAFIILLFSFSDLFVEKVEPKFIFSFWPVPGILYTFYLFFIYFGLAIYALAMLWKFQKTISGDKKLAAKYVFWGSIIGFGGGATNFFLWYDIPVYPYGNILVSFYPFVFAVASLRYRLFNIKVIAAELLTFVIWIAALVDLLIAKTLGERLLKGGILVFVVIFGLFLIKSVIKEVEQREKLEKLTKELEAANSFVSHQIKAPMAVVKGYVQLIAKGSYGEISKETKEIIYQIKKMVDRLIGLVDNFLDLRKIEEGKMEYQFKEIDIIDLTEDIIKELRILAINKKLNLEFVAAVKEIKIKADKERLRQVIQNLIENAIKYTDQGFVKIDLRLTTDDQQRESVLIIVSDSGRGISKELLPNLFQRFSRDSYRAREINGTGLGLFIAKEIIKVHKGEIWAESEGEGRGSRFFVKLPKTIE
jgi:signal transduction histidine kinase